MKNIQKISLSPSKEESPPYLKIIQHVEIEGNISTVSVTQPILARTLLYEMVKGIVEQTMGREMATMITEGPKR